jgi:hypothetical protein
MVRGASVRCELKVVVREKDRDMLDVRSNTALSQAVTTPPETSDVEAEEAGKVSCTAALTGAVVTPGGLQIAQPRQAPQSVAKFRKIRISFPLACLNNRRDWLRLVSFSYALIIGEIG